MADPQHPAAGWLRAAAGLCVLAAAWWLMMAVHELGHVVAALATGGHVDHVQLHPLRFSRTQLVSNPEPIIVVWAGPVVGVAAPLALYGLWTLRAMPAALRRAAPLAGFFAGFCLIANGLYLGVGWVDDVGDAGDMQRLGTPVYTLIAFGVVCCAVGLALWHTLGPWLELKHIREPDAAALVGGSLATLLLGWALAGVVGPG